MKYQEWHDKEVRMSAHIITETDRYLSKKRDANAKRLQRLIKEYLDFILQKVE